MDYEGIDWPVKTSFRRYVENMRDGAIDAADGATVELDTFRFRPASEGKTAADGSSAVLDFIGEVRFGGYGGLMVVPIKNPSLRFTRLKGTLVIDYPWKPDGSPPRLEIAEIEMSPLRRYGSRWEWSSTAVRLTSPGSELFNNSYREGDLLEPLHVSISQFKLVRLGGL